jgi:carbonic anhydrase/acetyltransferase-like protein (isoleucine patch superfamily)
MKLEIDESAYIDPAAVVIGNVRIGAEANVWPGAVLRAEKEIITVGRNTNIQDGCVLHFDIGFPVHVGDNVTVGHRAVVHGATVEDDCLIGIGAIVLNGARVGAGSVIAAGAVVREGMEIPPGSLVAGVPARVLKPVPDTLRKRMRENLSIYAELVTANRSGSLPRRG